MGVTKAVLVHGAWHGAWCWSRVATRLRGEGFDVATPTLTGLGERVAELSAHLTLHDHVADILDALDAIGEPVVLAGHSYAGFVVREAADRRPELVAELVLVDGWFGADGTSMLDVAPAWFADAITSTARDGLLPPPTPDLVGVTDARDAAWLSPRLTPHPLATFTTPTYLSGAVERIPTTAITAETGILPFAEWAGDAGWDVTTIAGGHDLMVTSPDQLASALARRLAPLSLRRHRW